MKAFSVALGASALAHAAAALVVSWPGPAPDIAPQVLTAELVFVAPTEDAEAGRSGLADSERTAPEIPVPAPMATVETIPRAGTAPSALLPVENPPSLLSTTVAPLAVEPPSPVEVPDRSVDAVEALAAAAPTSAVGEIVVAEVSAAGRVRPVAPAPASKQPARETKDEAASKTRAPVWPYPLPHAKPAPPVAPPREASTMVVAKADPTPPPLPRDVPTRRHRPSPPAAHETALVDRDAREQQTAALGDTDATPAADRAPLFAGPALHNPPPRYPLAAQRRGLEGRVILRVSVEATGNVDTLDVAESSGHRLLDRAALNAVRNWRFVPAQRNGTVVAATVDVPVRFTLRSRSAQAD